VNFFELFRNAFANWAERNFVRDTKTNKSKWRQYRHRPTKTDYVPAPRKGFHYEKGKLIANRRVA